jgi:hypothetical protein
MNDFEGLDTADEQERILAERDLRDEMTATETHIQGYRVQRGAYQGTVDNRIDRWYVCAIGHYSYKWHGYLTRKDALYALEQSLKERKYSAEHERMLSMRTS